MLDEDVLHLQIAARVKQRQRVREALGGAARDVEADVLRRLREEVVQVRPAQAGRHVRLFAVVERAQAFLEPEIVPEAAPEGDAAFARQHAAGALLEQTLPRCREVVAREAEIRGQAFDGARAQVPRTSTI